MVLQEKGERKRFLFVTLSPPQAPHFVKRWGSQHSRKNHESMSLPVVLMGLGPLDRPNHDEGESVGETQRLVHCSDPHISPLLPHMFYFFLSYPIAMYFC